MNIHPIDYKEYILKMDYKDVSLIDPPWNYNDKIPKTKKQLNYNLWNDNDKELDFCFENIKASYLFMWTTNSFIENCMKANHHKFVYKTMATWVKKTSNGKTFWGLGSNFRNCTEQLLLFTRKKEKPVHLSMRNLIEEKAGKRTQKPKLFEVELLTKLQEKNLNMFSYIFSGLETACFNKFDIDLVDISLTEKVTNEASTYFSN